METIHFPEDRCIMCGIVIPEGRQVCVCCEDRILRPESGTPQPTKTSPMIPRLRKN